MDICHRHPEKHQHASRRDATREATKINAGRNISFKAKRLPVVAYRCPACGWWHVGKPYFQMKTKMSRVFFDAGDARGSPQEATDGCA